MLFATTLYNDINNKNLVQNIKFRTDNFQKHYLKDVFQDAHIVLAQQHPKNMVRALTISFFTQIIQYNWYKMRFKQLLKNKKRV